MKGTHVDHPSDAVFTDAYRQDPYPLYARMRAEEPVAWAPALNAFLVTREADVATVLRDTATFSSDRVTLARDRFDAAYAPLFDVLALILLQRDGADHKRLRNLLHAAFKRTAVATYETNVRALAERLLEAAPAEGRFAYKRHFAVPLPILVISEIVGIPPEDRDQVKAWCDDFSVVALNFYAKISQDALDRGLASVLAFRAYLVQRIATLTESDTSLLNSLVHAEADGGRLTPHELLANVLLLLNAGNETTTVLLTNGLHRLLTTPGALARLRAERTLIPDAVEEMLRYDAPVQFIGRVATKDTALGDTAIPAGTVVLVFLGSAGRDERATPSPDTFDINRSAPHHLAFGHGPHVCAGLQLARLEGKIAFESLLDTFDDIRLADEEIPIAPNNNLRSVTELPLIVRKRP